MTLELSISPEGHFFVYSAPGEGLSDAAAKRIATAFSESTARGLLHLASVELEANLPASLNLARDLGRMYLTRLCHAPEAAEGGMPVPLAPPGEDEWASFILAAPPLVGLEYLNAAVLRVRWSELDELVSVEAGSFPGGVQAYLRAKNPAWRLVGRVTFHLAENKRDPIHPFAFMATYVSRLSPQGKAQHEPLGRALEQYAGDKNRAALLALLVPLDRAAQQSTLARELVASGDVYHPLAWTPREAHRFLQDIPVFEQSGLIVRVPNWWKDSRPPRPQVKVEIGPRSGAVLGAGELLDFSVGMALEGESLDAAELRALLAAEENLVLLKGKWVEVDRDKLREALNHWKRVEREARQEGGISFFEGMRLLAGAPTEQDAGEHPLEPSQAWAGIVADEALQHTLDELRHPEMLDEAKPPGLEATLRPYQAVGARWLHFVTRLGLGACLADDMGLGKTIQVIAMLLAMRRDRRRAAARGKAADAPSTSLLVVPASLIANWKSELERFAPSLSALVAHPSEQPAGDLAREPEDVDKHAPDLVITTYGMLARLEWLRRRRWAVVVLDEAQAIKNPGTRQTRAVNELRASGRVALTGTPVENRLGDLWSIFQFLNPGLLGTAKEFTQMVKRLEASERARFAPLRRLVQPYILRRLKTDKRVIADLPDKIESNAYCGLTKRQAALYQQVVKQLAEKLKHAEGIERRGIVLAQLMRLKQICNHPSQATGTGGYEPAQSGKFQRLAEICEELHQRQQRALVFTQFREIAEPLAQFLSGVFGRPGLVLHGGTSVPRRRELVDEFQREDGPPFFILSLKAGGTGLNLTSASHVIHFDRWWNPAVENQATDRAFRIGQQRNVFVHKFVCRGTVEEKIDALIAAKSDLARDLLEAGAEVRLTEMDNDQLLGIIALDIHKAVEH